MSVLVRGVPAHSCAPGWTKNPVTAEAQSMLPPGTTHTLRPPTRQDYPPGTVWLCDACGQTWVAYAPPEPSRRRPGGHYAVGMILWRAESRWSRWRRERKEKKG